LKDNSLNILYPCPIHVSLYPLKAIWKTCIICSLL